MSRPEIGDIVLAVPSRKSLDQSFQYVLVLDRFEAGASCVLVTLRSDLAIETDVIVPIEITSLSSPIVVHSLTGCQIPYERLSRTFAKCGHEVVSEVHLARFGEPSGRFESGETSLPIGDHREDQLSSIYAEFFEMFHITDDEVRRHESSHLSAITLQSQVELAEAIRRVQDGTATLEQSHLVRERCNLLDQVRTIGELDLNEEFKTYLVDPSLLAAGGSTQYRNEAR